MNQIIIQLNELNIFEQNENDLKRIETDYTNSLSYHAKHQYNVKIQRLFNKKLNRQRANSLIDFTTQQSKFITSNLRYNDMSIICPICLESINYLEKQKIYSWAYTCGHLICRLCDYNLESKLITETYNDLFQTNINYLRVKCPECRSPTITKELISINSGYCAGECGVLLKNINSQLILTSCGHIFCCSCFTNSFSFFRKQFHCNICNIVHEYKQPVYIDFN